MIEYCVGALVIWVIAGIVSIIGTCMPCFKGDRWDCVPIKYCLIAILFGPFTQLCMVEGYNRAMFPKD